MITKKGGEREVTKRLISVFLVVKRGGNSHQMANMVQNGMEIWFKNAKGLDLWSQQSPHCRFLIRAGTWKRR